MSRITNGTRRNGINLLKKLEEYKAEHFLFLHDKRVDATNNEAERYGRNFKRKQHQVTTFRSDECISDCCMNLGTIATLRNHGGNLYQKVSDVFTKQGQ